MKITITAIANTVLKKRSLQSAALAPHEISDAIAIGKSFTGKRLQTFGTHQQLELDFNAGTWWIYTPHWKIEERNMSLSQAGVDFIKRWEGLRLTAYRCSANVWTIGYGHTKTVYPGMVITLERAETLLREDLALFEAAVNKLVRVPLTQGQYDALVSFAFNCGISALSRSTLLKRLNQSDYSRAATEFRRWTRANGRVIGGLVSRRQQEIKMFQS